MKISSFLKVLGFCTLSFLVLTSEICNKDNEDQTDSGGGKYSDVYASEVHMLLGRVTGWNADTPPKCDVGDCFGIACQRDTYVCAAVLYAWAAEQYSQRGNPGDKEKAVEAAQTMHQQLMNAKNLCSTSPNASNCSNSCKTFSIYPC
jgi:hypothetical protein